MNKSILTILSVLAIIVAFPVMVLTAKPAKAYVSSSELNNLIVLNGLYGNSWGWGWNNSAQNLAGLIAVNNTLGNGSLNTNDLNNLIVINGLYGNTAAQNVAGLIAVNNATGGHLSSNDLSNLIVTNGLFTGYSPQQLAGLIATHNILYH